MDDLLTEEKAYEAARKNGAIFNQDVGSLTEEELQYIASSSPNVTLREYLMYRQMSLPELIVMHPELLASKDLSYNDAFDYVMRGSEWVREGPLSTKIKRKKIYDDLSPIGRGLLNILYEGESNYIDVIDPNVLEQVIISFDENMEDNHTVAGIAQSNGLEIAFHPVTENFIYKLNNYILSRRDITDPEVPSTTSLIQMNKQQFKEFLEEQTGKQYNDEQISDVYGDRLMVTIELFQ